MTGFALALRLVSAFGRVAMYTAVNASSSPFYAVSLFAPFPAELLSNNMRFTAISIFYLFAIVRHHNVSPSTNVKIKRRARAVFLGRCEEPFSSLGVFQSF